MRHFILVLSSSLIACSLAACVGVNKSRQNLKVYDFGLATASVNEQPIASNILLAEPVAAASLNHNKIRYRLNYQNPSQVFFYTESRWAVSPAELISARLGRIANVTNNASNCSLKLKIEAFDHVFQTVTTSEGVIELSALLIEKKSRTVISSQRITENISAPSPDAQGGVAALQQASDAALKKAINWGNSVAEGSALCR